LNDFHSLFIKIKVLINSRYFQQGEAYVSEMFLPPGRHPLLHVE